MEAWNQFLVHLEKELGVETVATWIRSLKILSFDAANLYLQASDPLQVSWFEEHVRPHVRGKFFNNNQRPIKIHLSLNRASPSPQSNPTPQFSIVPSPLDPEMALENFLPSSQNTIALEMLSSDQFNPIFLYGPENSGKTHLLMGAALLWQSRGKKVFYVRAEMFTEHVVQAIRLGFMQEFRKTYREIDVLLVDDIHIFSRKAATQEEFFHTFNALHTEGKQIILTANLPPQQLSEIEARLISRFEWGISLALEPHPARELLQKKSQLWHYPLSEELLDYLLSHFPQKPLRALQALLLRTKEPPTPLAAGEILKDILEQEAKEALTAEKMIKAVASYYAITADDLLGKSQARECAFPRKVAMYLCRKKLNLPFQKIGRIFNRDHSTVMTSVEQIEKEIGNKNRDLLEALMSFKF